MKINVENQYNAIRFSIITANYFHWTILLNGMVDEYMTANKKKYVAAGLSWAMKNTDILTFHPLKVEDVYLHHFQLCMMGTST